MIVLTVNKNILSDNFCSIALKKNSKTPQNISSSLTMQKYFKTKFVKNAQTNFEYMKLERFYSRKYAIKCF